MNDKNCRNCGAPVAPGEKCEYCGTFRPVPSKSMIKMTADSITFTCDMLQAGKVAAEQLDPKIIRGGMGT